MHNACAARPITDLDRHRHSASHSLRGYRSAEGHTAWRAHADVLWRVAGANVRRKARRTARAPPQTRQAAKGEGTQRQGDRAEARERGRASAALRGGRPSRQAAAIDPRVRGRDPYGGDGIICVRRVPTPARPAIGSRGLLSDALVWSPSKHTAG